MIAQPRHEPTDVYGMHFGSWEIRCQGPPPSPDPTRVKRAAVCSQQRMPLCYHSTSDVRSRTIIYSEVGVAA